MHSLPCSHWSLIFALDGLGSDREAPDASIRESALTGPDDYEQIIYDMEEVMQYNVI